MKLPERASTSSIPQPPSPPAPIPAPSTMPRLDLTTQSTARIESHNRHPRVAPKPRQDPRPWLEEHRAGGFVHRWGNYLRLGSTHSSPQRSRQRARAVNAQLLYVPQWVLRPFFYC